MHPSIVHAAVMYAVAAVIAFLVALLIKAMSAVLGFAGRKAGAEAVTPEQSHGS